MFSNILSLSTTNNKLNLHYFPPVYNLGLTSKFHYDYDCHNFYEFKKVIQVWSVKTSKMKNPKS